MSAPSHRKGKGKHLAILLPRILIGMIPSSSHLLTRAPSGGGICMRQTSRQCHPTIAKPRVLTMQICVILKLQFLDLSRGLDQSRNLLRQAFRTGLRRSLRFLYKLGIFVGPILAGIEVHNVMQPVLIDHSGLSVGTLSRWLGIDQTALRAWLV
jgi:hypothetical protein